jgi:hypothetical protein
VDAVIRAVDVRDKALRAWDKVVEWYGVAVEWYGIAVEWMRDPFQRYATLIGACFLVSMISFAVYAYHNVERVFFFPRVEGKSLSSESRTLPRKHGIEGQLQYYLREVVLGSTQLTSARLLPVDTKVNAVLVRKGTTYIDISSDIVLADDSKLTFRDSLNLVNSSIRYNFPGLHSIVLTLDGNLPWATQSIQPASGTQEKNKKR